MIKFESLWKNFPNKDNIKKSCTNKQKGSDKPFDNYCAILLSECLLRSGVTISNFKGTSCWSHSGKKHALLANDLANWLAKSAPAGLGKKEKIASGTFQEVLKGRTGIIYFKDYWRRGNESFNN